MPGSSSLFAESVEYKPFGTDPKIQVDATSSNVNGYDWADVVINYRTVPYQTVGVGATNIYTVKWAAKAEVMRLPNYGLQWASDSAPVAEGTLNAGKPLTSIEMHLTLHRVPSLPIATILGLLGKVNNATFQGCAAGTLLFAGANATQTVSTDGIAYEVDLVIAARVIDGNTSLTWNHYFRQSSGQFEALQTKSGNPIFASGSFASLL